MKPSDEIEHVLNEEVKGVKQVTPLDRLPDIFILFSLPAAWRLDYDTFVKTKSYTIPQKL